MSKFGPIKAPPQPKKKRRLGATQLTPGNHAGRDGLHGQPKDSQAYVPNRKRAYESGKDTPSGPGGSD